MRVICDSEMAGVGLPIFLPAGAWMKNKLRSILRERLELSGYQEVESPAIGDIELFRQSGHYPYYKDSMFPLIQEPFQSMAWLQDGFNEIDPPAFVLKPMNCPFHIAVYKDEPRSYRDLPLRYCEFGKVYRNEDSGSVNGLLRSRAFEQDDGHIFCSELQLEKELGDLIVLCRAVFADFQIEPEARLSLRGPRPVDGSADKKYVGSDALWWEASSILSKVLKDNNINYRIEADAAAFYGPKIDFVVKDKLGREWQLGTIQLDFNLPERFNLEFRNQNNQQEKPVMIHRAILGSLERFLGFLLSEDKIPNAIHPKLYAIVPVGDSEQEAKYAEAMSKYLFKKGSSNKVFMRDEPLKARIKRAKEEGYKYVAVFGPKELAESSLASDFYTVRIDNVSVLL